MQTERTRPTRPAQIDENELFLDRDLAWLRWAERVLDQARGQLNPPLERLRFLAIVSSTLDEFMMLRYGGLEQPLLDQVRVRVAYLVTEHRRILRDEVLPELERHGFRLLPARSLSGDDLEHIVRLLRDDIAPQLGRLTLEPAQELPDFVNLDLYLLQQLADDSQELLHIPAALPRYLELPGSGLRFVLLEDALSLSQVGTPSGKPVTGSWLFRVTRDLRGDLQRGTSQELAEVLAEHLKQRAQGAPLRLEVGAGLPAWWRERLVEHLGVTAGDVFEVPYLLNPTSLHELAQLPISGLHWPEPAQEPVRLLPAAGFADRLLSQPRQSALAVVDLLRSAANDDRIGSISMTLYRLAPESQVVAALEQAARAGKRVQVLVELQARFDEDRNLQYWQRLRQAGATLLPGVPGLKTHAKLLLLEGEEVRLAHIGTGNFNEVTGRSYSDLALVTADPEIASDVGRIFAWLAGSGATPGVETLWLAPVNLRRKLLAAIANETEMASAGLPARILLKVNSLLDQEIIQALYDASGAGVSIDLIVRGMCALRPRVPGLSDNIRVRSIVGRFLEHSRVFHFVNGGSDSFLLGSADLAAPNLDDRIEVLVPVRSRELQTRLLMKFESWLADNVRARQMYPDGTYRPVPRAPHAPALDSQLQGFRLD